ncbi:MAG: hypothetical protein AAFY41_08950 [Bacteroidota bacterium]
MIDEPQTMYNLTISLVATYLVGEQGWVVHNIGFDISPYCNVRVAEDSTDEYIVAAYSNKQGFEKNKLLEFEIIKNRKRMVATMDVRSGGVDKTGYNLAGWQVWHGLWNYQKDRINVARNIDQFVNIFGALWTDEGLTSNLIRYQNNITKGMSKYEAAFYTHTGTYLYDSGFRSIIQDRILERYRDEKLQRVIVDFVRSDLTGVNIGYTQPTSPR